MSRKLHNFAEIFFFGLRKNCHRLRDVRPAVVIGLLLFLGYKGLTMGWLAAWYGCSKGSWFFENEELLPMSAVEGFAKPSVCHCFSSFWYIHLLVVFHFPNKLFLQKLRSWWKKTRVRKSGLGGKKNMFFFSADSTSPVHLFMVSPFAILSIFPKEKTVIFVPRFSTPISGQAYIPPPWNGAVCNTPPYNEKGAQRKQRPWSKLQLWSCASFWGGWSFLGEIPGNDGHVANITAMKLRLWTVSPSFCMPDSF